MAPEESYAGTTRRPRASDVALVLFAPVAATLLLLVSAERFWGANVVLWWFGLAALPLMAVMAGLTRGKAAALYVLLALAALATSCAANLALIERCGTACHPT